MILSEAQEAIRKAARTFAESALAPNAAQWEEARSVPKKVLREMGALGFMGMSVPPEWGGPGADHVSCALALIEIARGDGAISTIMSGQNAVVCMPLLDKGTDAQRERYLRPVATGKMLGCFALTEPHGGSDASNLKTRAKRTESGWRIDGVKQFITSASIADFAIVFAMTKPDAGKKGLSAFLVPTDAKGFSVPKIEKKMGQNASDLCEVLLDGIDLPPDALLGAEGEGYKIALSNLEGGRIGIAAQCVGMAQAALDRAIAYSKERVTFGKRIAEHQAVAFRIAEMATTVHTAELVVLHAAALKDAGKPCLLEASMAKYFASEAAERVCSDAIQTLGGNGYTVGYEVERIYRAARGAKIYEGTNDIQRLVISRAVIGL